MQLEIILAMLGVLCFLWGGVLLIIKKGKEEERIAYRDSFFNRRRTSSNANHPNWRNKGFENPSSPTEEELNIIIERAAKLYPGQSVRDEYFGGWENSNDGHSEDSGRSSSDYSSSYSDSGGSGSDSNSEY